MSFQQGNIARMQSIADMLRIRQQADKDNWSAINEPINTLIGLQENKTQREYEAAEAEKQRAFQKGMPQVEAEARAPFTPTVEQQFGEAGRERDWQAKQNADALENAYKIALLQHGDQKAETVSKMREELKYFQDNVEQYFPDLVSTEGVLDWNKAINDPATLEKMRHAFSTQIAAYRADDQEIALQMFDGWMSLVKGSKTAAANQGKTTQFKPVDITSGNVQSMFPMASGAIAKANNLTPQEVDAFARLQKIIAKLEEIRPDYDKTSGTQMMDAYIRQAKTRLDDLTKENTTSSNIRDIARWIEEIYNKFGVQ